jgi:hypothetical protein
MIARQRRKEIVKRDAVHQLPECSFLPRLARGNLLWYLASMIERNRKLPQSRYYLRAATYGIAMLAREQPMDEGFLFMTVGILASLRAVQHSLVNHDSTLSEQHNSAVAKWKKSTPMDGPEITFIKTSRDLILKEGAFEGYAGLRHSLNPNTTGPRVTYDTGYWVDGQRRDLLGDMRAAADWCDKQLSTIEAQVPAINLPGDRVID